MLTFPSQLFTIHRLFQYDKIIIVAAAAINILLSVVLSQVLGIDGVLIGTLAASLIYLHVRIYILDRVQYRKMFRSYLKKLCFYYLISCVNFAVVYFTGHFIPMNGKGSFLLRVLLVSVLTVLIPVCFTFKTMEFRMFTSKFLIPFVKK